MFGAQMIVSMTTWKRYNQQRSYNVKHTVLFKLERETKGALRYQEVELDGKPVPVDSPADERLVGTLYVRKAKIQGAPQAVTVTVEY